MRKMVGVDYVENIGAPLGWKVYEMYTGSKCFQLEASSWRQSHSGGGDGPCEGSTKERAQASRPVKQSGYEYSHSKH